MAEAHPSRVGRRLAAIVAADLAGYSRLMGLDEVGTARTLREHRRVTDALVAKQRASSHHCIQHGRAAMISVEIADEVRRNYAVEDLSEPVLMFLENNQF